MNTRMVAWSNFVLEALADLGPEAHFVLFHDEDFEASDRFVSLKESFPGCAARWILYERTAEGRWLRQAA
jgi:hypothetical protein